MRRALDSIHGVDINPFAVAIARFRLVVAALRAAGYARLADAPDYDLHVAVGDSLLGGVAQGALFDDAGAAAFHYRDEDVHEHPGILTRRPVPRRGGQPAVHHGQGQGAQRGLPGALQLLQRASTRCRCRSWSCSSGWRSAGRPTRRGFVGQITSNSFMKREFGSKLIETLLSGADPANPVDLLDVIDTSGAYIPGHGTPTVILVGRRRRPVGADRARGPRRARRARPAGQPCQGTGLDRDRRPHRRTRIRRRVRHQSPTSTGACSRRTRGRLSGGGAGDVKDASIAAREASARDVVEAIGFAESQVRTVPSACIGTSGAAERRGIDACPRSPFVEGDIVRDFS